MLRAERVGVLDKGVAPKGIFEVVKCPKIIFSDGYVYLWIYLKNKTQQQQQNYRIVFFNQVNS